MSFYTSLSGLQGSQTELSTISHNLANVATNGFKRSRVEFGDVIASNATRSPNQQVGSGSYVKSIRQQFSQGGIQQSQSSLDLAISGEGFFVMKPVPSASDIALTRNGAFSVSADRYVVDSQGATLQVYPVDGSGNVVATGIDQTISLRLPQTSGTPIATSQATVSVNLSANAPLPANDPQWTAANPYAFDRFNPDTYNYASSSVIYDSVGNPVTLTNYYVRQTAPGGTSTTSDWNVYSFVGGEQISANPAQPTPAVPLTMTFDSAGVLTTPTGATTYSTFQLPSAAPQDISINFAVGTTQRPSSFAILSQSQNGEPIGQLQSVTVDPKGVVKASFSNGTTQALGQVVMAQVSNPQGLRQVGNGYWVASGLSGDTTLGQAGEGGYGSLMSGAIERSNVDMTEELVGLISAQRNFQANAKAIDTANQLSQTIINIRS
jgi:flagellar hook protein FlgE